MFGSRVTLAAVQYDLELANLWATDTYPDGGSFKGDTTERSGRHTTARERNAVCVVEFPPVDPANATQPLAGEGFSIPLTCRIAKAPDQ